MDRVRQTVKFYGLVYFQCKDGYLAASGLDGERLYLRTPPVVGDTADEVLPFFGFADACVFRVVPTLGSRAATSSVKGASGAADNKTEGSTACVLGSFNDSDLDPLKTIDIIDLEEITYGKSFSLVHEASGLFVSVAHALPSENDPDCLSVVLVKPCAALTPSCELSLVSRYKIHADGDKLCRADSVLIRLAATPMFLHVSSSPLMEPRGDNDGDIELLHRTFRFGSNLTYAAKSNLGPGGVAGAVAAAATAVQGGTLDLHGTFAIPTEHTVNAALERCSTDIAAEALTREYLDEVNACEEGGVSFTLHRYDLGTDRANRQRAQLRIVRPYIACGVPVAFYHRERESFLMISATQFAPTTEAEEERDFDRSISKAPTAEDQAAATTTSHVEPTVSPQGLRAVAVDSVGVIDTEDSLFAPILKSRQRKSTLNGVAALGGAEAAIRHATTSGIRRFISPGLPYTFTESGLGYSFTATMKQHEQQRRNRVRRTEGLMDTGRGRYFPFPVFMSTNTNDTTASEDLSLLDANRNCTTLWCFEHEEPMLGGPLRYGSSWRYRIRHVVSGMYLAVCGSAVDAMSVDYDDEDESVKEAALKNLAAAPASRTFASCTSSTTSDEEERDSDDGHDHDSTKNNDDIQDPKPSRSAFHLSSSSPRMGKTATIVGTAATVTTALDITAKPQLAATRETSLCLIPEPRTRKERESTIFCVEPMYATDSVYLIELACLSIKNVLTEMYVVTDASVDGSDVSLSLDWQPSRADPIVISYVPHQLQLDTRFIASQCTWLARYRTEMQALVLEHKKERAKTIEAALQNDEEAKKQLDAEAAYRSALQEMIRPYFNTPDSDEELLKVHKGFAAPWPPRSKDCTDNLTASYSSAMLGNTWSTSGLKSSALGYNQSFFGVDTADNTPKRPSYASMHNTIRLCQRALIALIEFCTESDETDVLKREGLPIRTRQALLYEMRLYRLLFDVILAPLQLLHSAGVETYGTYSSVVNSIAALMKSDYGSFDQIYETLRMAQQQQADLSCVWSGVWNSNASSSAAAAGTSATQRGGLGVGGEGLLDEKELMLPTHRELHLLTRLALRLLRQIVRGSAASFTAGWCAYIPRLLQLDGLRLHVVDTMKELFTDNPFISLRAVQQVSEHFICVTQQLRRGAYMDFLGAACTIKYRGVPERQAFVCQKLLVENPQSLCCFVFVVPPGKSETEGRVYVLPSAGRDVATESDTEGTSKSNKSSFAGMQRRTSSASTASSTSSQRRGISEVEVQGDNGICAAPPPGYVPFTEFFSSKTDRRQATFVANQIALFARLCYDGGPAMCRDIVARLFPPAAMKCLLRTFVWTGKQVVGNRCTHDVLRSFLIRLAMQCFVLPRMSAPAVQLRVSTVLFGSSQLRQHSCHTYSALPDDEMTALLKSVVVQLLRANPFFVQNDTDRSLLMRGAVSTWLKFTQYQQYTHEEVLTVLPLLLQLLDGTRDVLDANALHRANCLSSTVDNARRRQSNRGNQNSFAVPQPLASISTGGAGPTSRLQHKVESIHLMRIREMICQALFLALQHEVFRAADTVIVYLYKAYTTIDPGSCNNNNRHGGSAASGAWGAVQQTVSALSSAVQMPAVAVKELGSKAKDSELSFSEKSLLLSAHNNGLVTDVPPKSGVDHREEETRKRLLLATQRHTDGYHEIPDGPQGSITVAGGGNTHLQGSEMFSPTWASQLIRTEASSAYADMSSSDDEDHDFSTAKRSNNNRSEGKPGGGGGISTAEVQAFLDYHTSCIVEYFQPYRLVPYLFDVARYDCKPLTVQAMALLVQLCVVKRSIAQLVLKVNTLPSFEVLRSFDHMYEVAVRLKEACMNVLPGTPRATQWEPAIHFALDALNGPTSPSPQEADVAAESSLQTTSNEGEERGELHRTSSSTARLPGTHSSLSVAAKRAANFRRMYESLRDASAVDAVPDGSDGESEEEEERKETTAEEGTRVTEKDGKDKTPETEEATLPTSMQLRRQKEHISALWSKTSGAVRMLVYNNTIRSRRRALGLSETSTIPVNTIIRAEMMAHWKIHESLMQMLSLLTPADPIFKSVLRFFYLFTFSESNSLLLQPYVNLFLEKLDTEDASATVCLHIIVRVLRSKPHVEDYLTPQLLEAVVSHINDELYTKIPDPELVEMLSQFIFSKSSVSPVVRRRMMILFREHGTLMNLARFRLNPTPVEVVFTSALVNLVCSICGSHTSVLTLARSMLPAENICSVILQKRIVETLPTAIVDGSRIARLASRACEMSATPSAVAALKLLNPYVRILVALYFIPKNDSQDDNRRRCLQWMGSAQFWSIVKLFTAAMEAVSNAVEQDGTAREVNRGLNGIKVYHTLLCSTIPLAMAGFLINCFSNEGFKRHQKQVIGHAFYGLAAAAERFGALLMRHAAAVNITVEEVVNYRRFLEVLNQRFIELDDPSAVHAEELAERCNATNNQMRMWLSEQQQALESALVNMDVVRAGAPGPGSATASGPKTSGNNNTHEGDVASSLSFGSAASFAESIAGVQRPSASPAAMAAAYINSLRRREASTDDDIGAFRLLFAEEAVSQAQLRSQEMLEAAGLGVPDAHSFDSASWNREPEGADSNGFNSIGLLLPGVLASSRGVSTVRASLRATLHGDAIIPSVRRCPSEVSLIAIQQLLRSAHDEAMRESISCVLEALRNHHLRPRTFVGVLNLFSNALDTALHYPDLVKALCRTATMEWSDSAVSAPLLCSPSRRLPSSFAPKGSDADSAAAALNADAAVAADNLGYALQTTFNDTGMLSVVVSLCGLEEDVISLNAIRLGVLILEGGNRHAQTRLLDYFLTRDESFFHNVRDILHKNLSWVEHMNAEHQYYLMKRGMRGEQSKSTVAAANIQIIYALTPQQNGGATNAVDSNLEVFTASKAYVSSLHGNHKKWLTTFSSAMQVSGWARVRGSRRLKLITFLFRLLQLFCEGHFAGLQNYVRSQHDNLHSANVIIETVAFMEEMSTFITPSNYRVLLQGFELLTEVCQGPCRLNQEALIDYGVCRMVRHIVDYLQSQSGGDRRDLTALLQKVSGITSSWSQQQNMQLLRSRKREKEDLESDLINRLGNDEAARLRVSISNTLLAVLEGCRDAEAYRRVLRQIPLTSVAMEVQYAFSPATMHLLKHNEEQFENDDSIEAMFNWLIYLKSVEPYAELEGVWEGVETLLRSSAAVSQYLGSIEIKRADGLERVYFRIPMICKSLTQQRKDLLRLSVDRTSRATKLADFLHQSDEIIFAVERTHALRNRISRWTRFAVIYYDEATGDPPGIVRRAVKSMKVFYNNFVATKLFPYELASYDMVSMTLAVLSNTILVVLEGGEGTTKTPAKLYGDRVVFVLCALQVVTCGFVCIVYLTVLYPIRLYGAYKNKQRFAAGKVRLNVDLEEVYANLTVRERWASFLSWFDVQFRITLLFFAILSCTVSHYFAAFNLMLLVYSIPTLRTFISAITMNGKQLLLTSFMGVIMLYLFSIVGFLVFSTQYNPDGDDDGGSVSSPKAHKNCESLLQCFAYILDQGLRAGGGVGDVMQPWSWNNRRMLARLIYDTLFYALVTVVFLNILFGIIIDTFGQMRDEKRETETDMHGFCFICGLDADTLEKGSVVGFANHVKQEHNMWMYLYFMHHLRRKDSSEYTGQESYVNACIKRSGLNFFPEGNCVSLVEQKEQEEAEQANALGEDDEGTKSGGTKSDETVEATAQLAMKELTVARETINAHLKEWQSDSQRMKALLQQLELTSRSVAMDGLNAAARMSAAASGGKQGDGSASVRSGLTLPWSAKAETVTPSDAVAKEMQTQLGYASPTSTNMMENSSSNSGFLGSFTEPSGLRTMQAQLQVERELRQRYEEERQKMRALLKAKELELKRMKKDQSHHTSTEDSK